MGRGVWAMTLVEDEPQITQLRILVFRPLCEYLRNRSLASEKF